MSKNKTHFYCFFTRWQCNDLSDEDRKKFEQSQCKFSTDEAVKAKCKANDMAKKSAKEEDLSKENPYYPGKVSNNLYFFAILCSKFFRKRTKSPRSSHQRKEGKREKD